MTGNFAPHPGRHDAFNPSTSLGVSEAEQVRPTRLFSPFPAAFGPTLVQQCREALSKATAVQFLTVREAAARLHVSASTIYALCAQGKLPNGRVSNALRISVVDVEALLLWGRPPRS